MKKLLLITTILTCFLRASGQIDSLRQQFELTSGQAKLTSAIAVGKQYLRRNLDSARYFFWYAYTHADENIELKSRAVNYYAVSLTFTGRFDSSEYYFKIADNLAKPLDNYDLNTTILNNQNINYYYQGKYEQVIQNYQKYYQLALDAGNIEDQSMALNNAGLTYLNIGSYYVKLLS